MSAGIDDHGAAFPVFPDSNSVFSAAFNPGMSLRDYFAGQALAGIAASSSHFDDFEMARWCYRMADIMLQTRFEGGAE